LRIRTSGFIPWHELSSDQESVDYDPIGYRTLNFVFRQLPVHEHDVFLDYGCGMGRPLLVAASQGFSRVIGVELSPVLCQAARRNASQVLKRQPQCDVDIVNANAAQFVTPDDVTVIFMFNPFTGETLRNVVSNIHQSWRRRPREIRLAYVLPVRADNVFADCDWLALQRDCPSQGLRVLLYRTTAP